MQRKSKCPVIGAVGLRRVNPADGTDEGQPAIPFNTLNGAQRLNGLNDLND